MVNLNSILFTPPLETTYSNIETNSWFKSVQSNSNNESQIWSYNKTKDEEIELHKTITINVYPTSLQKKILLEWIDLYRITYNKTIKYFKHHFYSGKKIEEIPTYSILRKNIKNELVNNNPLFNTLKMPKMSIDRAINDVYSNYKQQMTCYKQYIYKKKKYKKKNKIKKFNFTGNYKKQSSNRQIIKFEACLPVRLNDLRKEKIKIDKIKNTIYEKILGPELKTDITLKDKDGLCTLQYNRCKDTFKLFVTEKNKVEKELKIISKNIIALDPGERTFQTGYDSKGNTVKIGNKKETLRGIFKYKDKLEKKYRENMSKRSKLKVQRIEEKIKNKIKDLHWKTIKYLTDRYDTIAIGKFNSSSVIQGNIPRIVKKSIQALSHYTFRRRLEFKCIERGIHYEEINEYNTTRTCGNCSHINENVYTNEIFTCPMCHYIIDRDVNASRNIFIRFFN